jgi:hypothetical protein
VGDPSEEGAELLLLDVDDPVEEASEALPAPDSFVPALVAVDDLTVGSLPPEDFLE